MPREDPLGAWLPPIPPATTPLTPWQLVGLGVLAGIGLFVCGLLGWFVPPVGALSWFLALGACALVPKVRGIVVSTYLVVSALVLGVWCVAVWQWADGRDLDAGGGGALLVFPVGAWACGLLVVGLAVGATALDRAFD